MSTKHHSISRRSLLKSGLVAATTLATLPLMAQTTRGIRGQTAPELEVADWIDGDGNKSEAFSIAANRGKWIYLKCFQEWCPACHSVGFPNLQKLVAAFPDINTAASSVVSAVVQTTFEGFSHNDFSALRKNQLRYNLALPFAHDAGNIDLPANNKGRYPLTMSAYKTGGTPWVVIIDPQGTVVFNDFHIDIDKLIQFLKHQEAA